MRVGVAYRSEAIVEDISPTKELIARMDADYRFHPLYGLAMLKVSFGLRPGIWPGFNDILKETLQGVDSDEGDLDGFIEAHRSNLERRCKEVGI